MPWARLQHLHDSAKSAGPLVLEMNVGKGLWHCVTQELLHADILKVEREQKHVILTNFCHTPKDIILTLIRFFFINKSM